MSQDALGWVYVIINDDMPGLLKVGYSMKDPVLRAKELASTGVPGEYCVKYAILTHSPFVLEKKVHKALKAYHYNKEWFRTESLIAIQAIKELCTAIVFEYGENPEPKQVNIKSEIMVEIELRKKRLAAKNAANPLIVAKKMNREKAIQSAHDKPKISAPLLSSDENSNIEVIKSNNSKRLSYLYEQYSKEQKFNDLLKQELNKIPALALISSKISRKKLSLQQNIQISKDKIKQYRAEIENLESKR